MERNFKKRNTKMTQAIQHVQQSIIECSKCPRLMNWCKKISIEKRKSFSKEKYWGKPVSGFGDPSAKVLIVGLAPAAHGANRTGRMFTGDNSGKWLYRALYEQGFSNQEESVHRTDSLKLINAYVTSIVHCAPPDNKPTIQETNQCIPYLEQELTALKNVNVIIALGKFAWDGVHKILREKNIVTQTSKFGHGVVETAGPYKIIGSYHPSQQNTFTKRLTKPMFDGIFVKAKSLL